MPAAVRAVSWRRLLGGAFTAAALAWLLLVLLAPLSVHGAGGKPAAVAAATYLIGGVVCHQRPDRSFHPGGVQMPVCARCTGLYLGGAAGVLVAAGRRRRRGRAGSAPSPGPGPAPSTSLGPAVSPGPGPAPAWLRWAVVAAAAPTALSFAAEAVGWMPSFDELRAAAGVPLGVAVTWVASLVIRGELA